MEFRILGPLEVVEAGRSVALGGLKQRAVLAILLLNANAVVAREHLIDELWGDEPPKTADATLRVLLSRLRKALPRSDPEVIESRSPGYLLRLDPEDLDLARFERLFTHGAQALADGDAATASRRLHEALGLWRGRPLADFPYENFAQAPAARLEEMRLGALELRIEADMCLGRHAELVPELDAVCREHPLRERFSGQLMLALYRSGRQAQSLEVYDQTRRMLDTELGIEPSRMLKALQHTILRQDHSLDLRDSVADRPAAVTGQGSILAVAVEWDRIDRLLAFAASLGRLPLREILLVGLASDADDLAHASAELALRRDELSARGLVVRSAAFTTPSADQDVIRLTSDQDAELLLLDVPLGSIEPRGLSAELGAILRSTPCDVALVVTRDDAAAVEASGPILVPFGGADNDWAAVELGARLARARDVELRLLGSGALPSGTDQRDASRLLATASIIVQRVAGIAAEPLLIPPGLDALLDATAEGGLLVMGLSGRWQREGLGEVRLALARHAAPQTLLVRGGLRPSGLAPPHTYTRYTWSLASPQSG